MHGSGVHVPEPGISLATYHTIHALSFLRGQSQRQKLPCSASFARTCVALLSSDTVTLRDTKNRWMETPMKPGHPISTGKTGVFNPAW